MILGVKVECLVELPGTIEVQPHLPAERVRVDGAVEPAVVGDLRVVLKRVRGIPLTNLDHLRDAPAGVVAVLDPLALGARRGHEQGAVVLVAGAGKRLRDLLRGLGVHEQAVGISVGTGASRSGIGHLRGIPVLLERHHEEGGADVLHRALLDRDLALRVHVLDARVVEGGPVLARQAPLGVELIGHSPLGLHGVGVDPRPLGSHHGPSVPIAIDRQRETARIGELGSVVGHLEAPDPLAAGRVVARRDLLGAEQGVDR